MNDRYAKGIAWGEMKQELFEYLNNHLQQPRQLYEELLQSPDHSEEKLLQGAKKAREYSIPFLNDVRKAVGIQKLGSI